MKTILYLFFVFCISHSYSASIFKVPKDKSKLRSLISTKQNHLIILKKYSNILDSQIIRLSEGIYQEKGRGSNIRIFSLNSLFAEIVLKNIFINKLYDQLYETDLDRLVKLRPPKEVFQDASFKINLADEIGIYLNKVLPPYTFNEYLIEEFAQELIKHTLKIAAKKTYTAIGSGLLTKLVTTGITKTALKSSLITLASEAFVSAGAFVIIELITLPFHAYRLPAEEIWLKTLEKNPELIINPEWMKYAGSQDHPWYTHGYTILRRTERLEMIFNNLLEREEANFISRISNIYSEPEKDQNPAKYRDVYITQPDATYVARPIRSIYSVIPSWALKKN